MIYFCTAATGSNAGNSTLVSGSEILASVEVVKQLQDLESCFSSMLTSIRTLFTSRDLAEMQFFLDDLFETHEFRNCGTIDEILWQLRQSHVDTFNIHCLKELARHFQRDEVHRLIDEYNNKMEAFLTGTVVTQFHQAIVSRVDPVLPSEMAVVTIKIPQSLANRRTLKDMERLAGRAFGEYYRSFVNLHVVPGPIVIIWFFPECFTDKLEQLAQANTTVFLQEGVEEVTITVAGRMVFPGNSEKVCEQE